MLTIAIVHYGSCYSVHDTEIGYVGQIGRVIGLGRPARYVFTSMHPKFDRFEGREWPSMNGVTAASFR